MTNAINSVAGVDDFATMVKDLMAERDKLQADLAAARALLAEAKELVPSYTYVAKRIDAALAGEKK